MANMLPVAVYGLRIEPEDGMIPAMVDFPATVSHHMKCSSFMSFEKGMYSST